MMFAGYALDVLGQKTTEENHVASANGMATWRGSWAEKKQRK